MYWTSFPSRRPATCRCRRRQSPLRLFDLYHSTSCSYLHALSWRPSCSHHMMVLYPGCCCTQLLDCENAENDLCMPASSCSCRSSSAPLQTTWSCLGVYSTGHSTRVIALIQCWDNNAVCWLCLLQLKEKGVLPGKEPEANGRITANGHPEPSESLNS